jgi:hypothetical protein
MINTNTHTLSTWKYLPLFIFIFFYFITSSYAMDVTLQWLPNSETDLAGYKIFFREESQSYDYYNPSWEGVETSCTIYGLDETKSYYFVARAFDTEAFESSNSNEVYLEAAVTPDNQPPIAVIAEDYIETIPGTKITLDGSNSTDADDGIASYLWTQVDGTSVTLSNYNSELATFTAPETDQYGSNLTFKLTVTDFGGLQGTADSFIYVRQNELPNNPPYAVFNVVISKKVASFTDNSSDTDGTIVSWFWNFGDGQTSTERNPKHRYSRFGNYSVTLTVTDDGGISNFTSKNITVTR